MITNVRGQGQVELRAFSLTDMVRWGYNDLRGGGGVVGESAVKGIPALYRAARMRAEAIATLQLCVWKGDGPDRTRNTDSWQARLFRDAPNEAQTRFGFWETVEESLAWRNNAYVWKMTDPLTLRVVEMYALHPDQVHCTGPGEYDVTVRAGFIDPMGRGEALYHLTESDILHIRGHGDGGKYEAPTPIQVFREALEAPVQRQRHETRVWRKGAPTQLAVIFPDGVSKEQADEWKQGWRDEYTDINGETTPFMGGGADIKPIGMTLADAMYVEMAKLTVHDASRIMGVPANLLGAQTERAVPNLEQDLATWLRFGLGPEMGRIESALESDEELFGNSRLLYPAFDAEDFIRGDVRTEADILVSLVQAGILLPDEARRARGLDDLPDGAGKVPQITPVGGAPNPNAKPQQPEPAMNGAGGYD